MKEDPLEKHILGTYLSLRYGLAFIAFAFPPILWIGGHLYANAGLQNTMSAYYYACADGRSMRTWFVGTLFAVGTCLYLYKGYRQAENIALNCAGVLALGIALFPMDWTSKSSGIVDDSKVRACLQGIPPTICGTSLHAVMHAFCAISFFLCIAFVCLFCASDTLPLIKNKSREDTYRRIYHLTGGAMIVSPIIAFLLTQVLVRYNFMGLCCGGIWDIRFCPVLGNQEPGNQRDGRRTSCDSGKTDEKGDTESNGRRSQSGALDRASCITRDAGMYEYGNLVPVIAVRKRLPSC